MEDSLFISVVNKMLDALKIQIKKLIVLYFILN